MLNELIKRYPVLEGIKGDIERAVNEIIDCYEKGGKVLLCGNGGSAADCEHIAGELMKGFLKKRPLDKEKREEMKERVPDLDDGKLSKLQGGLPAVSLGSMTALNTAFGNDVDSGLVFAQSVLTLAGKGDILIAMSTSGNSENICDAAMIARSLECRVIGFTGKSGGKLKDYSDVCLCVPEEETFKVQELHLPVYHCICAMVEERFFKE